MPLAILFALLFVPSALGAAGTATVTGDGDGVITSAGNNGDGFDCNKGPTAPHTDCAGQASIVGSSFTATPEPGSVFTAWTVTGTGTGSTCKTTPTANPCTLSASTAGFNIAANFDALPAHTLEVSVAAPGGQVSADSGDISACTSSGGTCSGPYSEQAIVELTATPDSHFVFAGWSGPDAGSCSTDPVCELTMPAADAAIVATFAAAPEHTVALTVGGAGQGQVSADSGDISACTSSGGTCSGLYEEGSTVTLTAVASPGSEFSGWSGPDAGSCSTDPACELTVPAADAAVTASFALAAPIVATLAEGALTQTTAVLNGTVDNNGVAGGSACTFQVTTPADPGFAAPLGSFACDVDPVNGDGDVAVSATATGLVANTEYIYRVRAASTAGTSTGDPEPFKTLPNPPTVTLLSPQGITQTTATIRGQVNNNAAAGGTTCTFQLALASDPTFSAPLTAPACSVNPVTGSANVAVNAALGGLDANTQYIYRIVATNSGGTTEGAPAQTLTTLPNVPIVATLAEGTVTQASAVLNGTLDNRGAPTGSACSFEVTTATAPGGYADGISVPCDTTPVTSADGVATPVSAIVDVLHANTRYIYRLSAQNSGGAAVEGADEEFTTPPNPPTIAAQGASGIAQGTATLNATVDPNFSGVSSCLFEWGADTSYGHTAPCEVGPGDGGLPAPVEAKLSGLLAGTTYHFRLRAQNGGGVAFGSDATFATLADTCETNASLCPAATPAPAATPSPKPTAKRKPRRCRKGFAKRRVRGKVRCVKKKHRKRHRHHEHRANHDRGSSR